MAVLLEINYSFRTYRYHMSKSLKTLSVPIPDRRGGFGTGGESASRRVLRSSLNPRPEDTAHEALCDAGLCKKRCWAVTVKVQGVMSGATTRPQMGGAHQDGQRGSTRRR